MARNLRPLGNLNLFESNEVPTAAETLAKLENSSQSAQKIENPCPRCGSRSQKSVRPHEHDDHTHYCAGGCLSEDRTDAFYFTPEALPLREVETETVGEGRQQALIETGEKWEEEWQGMPEFVQEDLTPWNSIYVHFETREDIEKFAKLVRQKIGLNTRSIWFPEAEIGRMTTKRYVEGPVDKRTKDDSFRNEPS